MIIKNNFNITLVSTQTNLKVTVSSQFNVLYNDVTAVIHQNALQPLSLSQHATQNTTTATAYYHQQTYLTVGKCRTVVIIKLHQHVIHHW